MVTATRGMPFIYAQSAAVNIVFYTVIFGIPSYLHSARVSTGISNLSLQAALYRVARPDDMGAASGPLMTARYCGTTIAAAILGVVFAHTIDTARLHAAAWMLVARAAAAFLWTCAVRLAPPRRECASRFA